MQVICNGYFYKDEKSKILDAVGVFNSFFDISDNFYFSLNSVTDSEISKINADHFNKDYSTDVLSFPLFSNYDEITNLNSDYEESLGDMFVCRPVLKKNAAHYGKDFIDELQLVLVHGLLHLVGYSHSDKVKMREKENKILHKVWNEFKR